MRLKDMRLLQGQVEEITIVYLRKSPGDVIDQVQMGKTFIITRRGKAAAVLSSPEHNAFELGAKVRRMGLAG